MINVDLGAVVVSPLFWASIALIAAGVWGIRRKTNGGVIVGGLFLIGGIYGLLILFDLALLGIITLIVIFICCIMLVITEGWITRIIGVILGIAVYFELERISPPDSVFGVMFSLIRQAVGASFDAIARSFS